jgi:hypothetical protein
MRRSSESRFFVYVVLLPTNNTAVFKSSFSDCEWRTEKAIELGESSLTPKRRDM